jgi:lactosylceramide 4-alpha-galactosyltransferase
MNPVSDMLRFAPNRPLTDLGTNFVVAQSADEIASGALNFDMDSIGRTAAHLCLTDIQRNFNGQEWAQNGPWVIRRVLQAMCGRKHVSTGI